MWQRIRQQLNAGQMPADDLIDGGLVLAAGILLLLPGFDVRSIIGLIVLFPPTPCCSATSYAGASASSPFVGTTDRLIGAR